MQTTAQTVSNTNATISDNENGQNAVQPAINAIFMQWLQLYPQLHVQLRHKHLSNLLQYIQNNESVKKYWLSPDCVPVILEIITSSLFRSLPKIQNYDAAQDKSWVYLQLVYQLLHLFVSTCTVETLQKRIHTRFIHKMVQLLTMTPNSNEREYLKHILHTIYRRSRLNYGNDIRTAINNFLYSMIHSHHKSINTCAIPDLLQILSSIISTVLDHKKPDHISLLTNLLIPMHKLSFLSQFHKELMHCIMQFIGTDTKLASVVIVGLLKYWPLCSTEKELLFLSELERILPMMDSKSISKIMIPLFKRIAKCMASPNYKIAESALLVWSNAKMMNLVSDKRKYLFPILYPNLQKSGMHHWNSTITAYTKKMTATFHRLDTQLFKKVHSNHVNWTQNEIVKKQKRALKWTTIRKMAMRNVSKN